MGKGVPWSEKESVERIIWRKLDEWWHRPKFGVRWREKWGFHLPCWSLRKSRREWVLVAIVKQVSAQLPPRLALGHRAPDEKVILGFYFHPLLILGSCRQGEAGTRWEENFRLLFPSDTSLPPLFSPIYTSLFSNQTSTAVFASAEHKCTDRLQIR